MAKRKIGILLEAEVAPGGQKNFEKRYLAATGKTVKLGKPSHYQNQDNKWGAELRVYFNDPGMAAILKAKGVKIENRKSGYLAGEYQYRFNNSKLWWALVETLGLRLGLN